MGLQNLLAVFHRRNMKIINNYNWLHESISKDTTHSQEKKPFTLDLIIIYI